MCVVKASSKKKATCKRAAGCFFYVRFLHLGSAEPSVAGRIATIVAGGNIYSLRAHSNRSGTSCFYVLLYSISAQGIRLGASHSARLQNEPPWSNLHSLACASTDSLRLIILLASSQSLRWHSALPHLRDYFPSINCSRFISWLYFAEPRLSFSRIADVRSIPSTAAMAIT